VSLSRTERLQNLLWAFQWKKSSITIPSTTTHIIIIDDLTTTGSTLEQVGKSIIQKNTSVELRWCVIARHN
jgi:predicted amidophosphoribosyltransferase